MIVLFPHQIEALVDGIARLAKYKLLFLGLIIGLLIPQVGGFIKTAYHRELYRMQVVCVDDAESGYRKGPCDYWKGPRP